MEKIKFVLFDLDGTLLPMDQNKFIEEYFSGLAKALAPLGYEQKSLVSAIWRGTGAMIKNGGSATNEEVFWNTFASIMGESVREQESHFNRFYEEEFDKISKICGYTPNAKKALLLVRSRGARAVLATNPIFPAIATRKRMSWAGVSPDDFEFYTTYENSKSSKPSLAYYEEILTRLGARAEECLMVGNDVSDDMVAQKLGMKVFLLTDCLINRTGEDISVYRRGGFEELLIFLDEIL